MLLSKELLSVVANMSLQCLFVAPRALVEPRLGCDHDDESMKPLGNVPYVRMNKCGSNEH